MHLISDERLNKNNISMCGAIVKNSVRVFSTHAVDLTQEADDDTSANRDTNKHLKIATRQDTEREYIKH